MSVVSRRKFLGAGAAVAATSALPAEAKPKPKPHGDLRDIKHVVVVMQENRSFDHYFGSMKGVRGFGDRATILLPGGKTVWQQPQAPVASAPTQYPWPLSGTKNYSGSVPPTPELGAANYPRHEPQLGGPARRVVRRVDERLGLCQGRPDHARLSEPPRPPVSLRARGRVYHR